MDARTHFKEACKFHKTMTDHHSGAEEDHRAIASECEGEMAKRHESLADHHAAMKAAHAGHAEHHIRMHADAASKAVLDELAKGRAALESPRVSGVAPTNPNLRAVIRPGQPLLEKTVDPEFAALVSSGDDRTE